MRTHSPLGQTEGMAPATSTPVAIDSASSSATRWRRLTVLPALTVLGGVVLGNVAGGVVADSPLLQSEESWVYLLGSLMLTIYFGAPLLVLTLVTGAIGFFVKHQTVVQVCAWVGAVAVALAGGALFLVTVTFATWEPLGARVFFAAMIVVALWFLLPLMRIQSLRRRT